LKSPDKDVEQLDAETIRRYVSGLVRRNHSQPDQEVRMEVTSSEASPLFDKRPWGSFTVLDEGKDFKVKRIEVLPGKRLSYQKHSQRAEHWFVVHGTAKVTLDDREITVMSGEAIDIRVGSAHRVENPAEEMLVFIEVQRGSYLGEDDIIRLSDDFGRS